MGAFGSSDDTADSAAVNHHDFVPEACAAAVGGKATVAPRVHLLYRPGGRPSHVVASKRPIVSRMSRCRAVHIASYEYLAGKASGLGIRCTLVRTGHH